MSIYLTQTHKSSEISRVHKLPPTAVFITIELFLLREEVDSRKEQVSDMPTSWLC
jgi:hypothetical protein